MNDSCTSAQDIDPIMQIYNAMDLYDRNILKCIGLMPDQVEGMLGGDGRLIEWSLRSILRHPSFDHQLYRELCNVSEI